MVTEVISGELSVVGGMVPLDGRASWAPKGATGYQPSNCFVLHGEEALLVDTGVASVERGVVQGLSAALDDGETPSVFLTRAGPQCSGNLGAVASTYSVRSLFAGGTRNPFDSYDEVPVADTERRAEALVVMRSPSESRLELYHPALRLLSTTWGYDARTKTVFTSDSFSHVTFDDEARAPIISSFDDDTTTVDDVRAHLFATFWWLPYAVRDSIAADVRSFFAEHEVDIIAPTAGGVIKGPELVARHVALLLEVLENEEITA